VIRQAECLISQSKIPQALTAFTEVLDTLEHPPFRGTAIHQSILKAVGELHYVSGNYRAAEKRLFEYLATDASSLDSAKIRLTLAQVYYSSGKLQQALALLQPAIAIANKASGTDYDPTLIADSMWLQSQAYRDSGMLDDATESCLEAIAILEDVYGPTHPQVLLCQCSLDNLSITRGDLAEAAASLPRILHELREQLGARDCDLITPLAINARLAVILAREVRQMRASLIGRNELHEKEALIELLGSRGLRGSASRVLADRREFIPNKTLQRLMARLERNLLKRAKMHLVEALTISKTSRGEDHPANVELLDKLSVVCEVLHQEAESRHYESAAEELRELNREQTQL
jgi:tetratricopeptide (TPR) repeat protein